MNTPRATHAIVRAVPNTFHRAITPKPPTRPIDVAAAREQHQRYCEHLENLGLTLIEIPADDRFPDCCFVEDTAVLVGRKAIIANMAAPTRRGEEAAVRDLLQVDREIHAVREPATLDGGDVLAIGETLYVGRSSRTNLEAADQLAALLAADGYRITRVAVHDILHLKSACTYLGGDVVVWLPGHLEERAFDSYRRITVPDDETHAANCLSVNGVVLIPTGAPRTRRAIEKAGFETLEVEIGEAIKAGAGLTCSSILF